MGSCCCCCTCCSSCCKTSCHAELTHMSDQSRWMEELPDRLRDIPLNQMAIPGSHDSFTFYLDKSGPIVPDEPRCLQKLGNLSQCARNIIYNWAAAQSLSVCDQLNAGIRYFDIRIGVKANSSELYCVHGLFGPKIDDCMEEVALFLDDHASEVVLLDFNHLCNVSKESHLCLIDKILKRFPSKLCPLTKVNEVTLNSMSQHGFQLIVFYKNCISRDYPMLWPGCSISSPWPNKHQVQDLLDTLEENFQKARDISKFYVSQGVLTPTACYIICHACKTLKQTLAQTAARPFVGWLKPKTAGPNGINICIMDCVELENYVASVIQLNYSPMQ